MLAAAYTLLVGRGYGGMSIEAVAAEAGVGNVTIYRWWKGRQEIAVEFFFAATVRELAFPQTSTAREDFRQQVLGLRRCCAASETKRCSQPYVRTKH